MRRIGETNKVIIRLRDYGRKPFSLIANKLSITENTVRAQLNKLVDEELLPITSLINPQCLSN